MESIPSKVTLITNEQIKALQLSISKDAPGIPQFENIIEKAIAPLLNDGVTLSSAKTGNDSVTMVLDVHMKGVRPSRYILNFAGGFNAVVTLDAIYYAEGCEKLSACKRRGLTRGLAVLNEFILLADQVPTGSKDETYQRYAPLGLFLRSK